MTPSKFVVRQVGQGATGSEGKIIVSGHEHYGVFAAASGELVLAPPNSVSIALTESLCLSWRVDRRQGASGVGRGDYDWILELYSWPDNPEFLRGYTVRSRETIAWCWPIEITCPKTHSYRVCGFKCRSEDFKDEVFVILHADGTFSETRDRKAALALAKDKPDSPVPADAEIVAQRVPADRQPQAFATSAIGVTLKRYLDALKRMGFVPQPCGPASATSLQGLESSLGHPIPGAARELLSVADGESETEGSLLGGYVFLSLERIESIRLDSPTYFPIAKEPLEPNYIALDASGRVVPVGRDERSNAPLFPNLEAFLAWLADEAEQQHFRISSAGTLKYLEHRYGRLPEAIRRTAGR